MIPLSLSSSSVPSWMMCSTLSWPLIWPAAVGRGYRPHYKENDNFESASACQKKKKRKKEIADALVAYCTNHETIFRMAHPSMSSTEDNISKTLHTHRIAATYNWTKACPTPGSGVLTDALHWRVTRSIVDHRLVAAGRRNAMLAETETIIQKRRKQSWGTLSFASFEILRNVRYVKGLCTMLTVSQSQLIWGCLGSLGKLKMGWI